MNWALKVKPEMKGLSGEGNSMCKGPESAGLELAGSWVWQV